ncbi:hypothetical protein M1466_02455 [Candidatus Dependentiae bacterium]|nr:hypothetical protein [Candidatus Dependentiae bacterium]
MEALAILEKRVTDLLQLVKELKAHNTQLQTDNTALQAKVDSLENSLLTDRQELVQEKELTKLFVDGLINDIDSFVSAEQLP